MADLSLDKDTKKGNTFSVSSSMRAVASKKKSVAKPVAKKSPEEVKKDPPAPSSVAMSTDAFSKEILTEFHKRTKVIKDSIGNIDSSFEKIAFNLHWINAKQAYKSEGFDNIIKYAENAFGYQKTTCYSLISVVDRFAKRDEKGAFLEAFDDRVKGYSVSKLSLMVNLTDAEIESLNPGMSVRDIKAYVKSLEGKPLPALSDGSAGSEGSEEESEEEAGSGNDDVIVDAKEVTRQVLITCKGKEDCDAKIDKIDDFINRVFKRHSDAVIEISYTLPDKE